jgi:L-asparaginase II
MDLEDCSKETGDVLVETMRGVVVESKGSSLAAVSAESGDRWGGGELW